MVLYSLLTSHYPIYTAYLTSNYVNVIGFLLVIIFSIQFITGILLSVYYSDFFTIAYDSIIHIIISINGG